MTPAALRKDVSVQIDESTHVATVEMRRRPNNFFDYDVLSWMVEAIEQLADLDIRAIVLCSEGKNFCAGADFSGASGSVRREGAPHIYNLAIRLFEQPIPLIAAVQGAAVGGGLGLALAADFRIATPTSRFSANFSMLGFHPGFGISITLPMVVGNQVALDLLYTARRVDGVRAQQIGLCDALADEADLRARATAFAHEIASAAPLAVRAIRQTLRGSMVEQVRAALQHERAEQERLQSTADFREGLVAARERRPAIFLAR
jgi:2-(1,2-epoxy-1,2-dihydrophenyl)acetyl-CoA isomerase